LQTVIFVLFSKSDRLVYQRYIEHLKA